MYKAKTFSELVFQATPSDQPWQQNNISPATRTAFPVRIHKTEGTVAGAPSLCQPRDQPSPQSFHTFHSPKNNSSRDTNLGSCLFTSADSLITFDFGQNICGVVTLKFGPRSSNTILGLAFSESSDFVGRNSDKSVDFKVTDGHVTVEVYPGISEYTMPVEKLRGAFRYLTVFVASKTRDCIAHVTSVSCNMTQMPSSASLNKYSGFFHSSDPLLNKIWYAGAYTIQLATISSVQGRKSDYVVKSRGWDNSGHVSQGLEVLTDGAKRDRSVWSGDRLISTSVYHCAFGGVNSAATATAIDWIFAGQQPDGRLPYACKPADLYGSDTFHLWGLLGLYELWQHSGDFQRVRELWVPFKKGVELGMSWIDSDYGLAKIVCGLDWGRSVLQGHSLSLNVLLYACLVCSVEIGNLLGEPEAQLAIWINTAESLHVRINELLWDAEKGLFKDNLSSTLYPQDGNCLVIYYGVCDGERSKTVSERLFARWNQFGPINPESNGMISTFISGIEVMAHHQAGRTLRALALIRQTWSYALSAPWSVKSSLVEGFYKDGTCSYPSDKHDSSYISHSHPWSTGPTSFLSYKICGLRFTNPNHVTWTLQPTLADLDFCITGFTSAKTGYLVGGWKRDSKNLLQIAVKSTPGTIGEICVPLILGKQLKMTVNGVNVNLLNLEMDEGWAYVKGIEGGCHTVYAWYLD